MALRCVICRDRESAALENSQLGLYRCRSCGHVFKLLPEEKRQNYGEDYYLREHKNWFNNPDYRLFEHINTRIIKARGDRKSVV